MKKNDRFQVSPERFRIIYQEVKEGSEPGLRFYILVAVSTLIAGLGLVTNSTAVVIGAMLVAPLMTPIFGMTLALIRGNTELLGKSIRAEVVGVVASVFMGFILGSLAPMVEATPEMLARTEPNLFDLMVAILAGFAGSYAMVDEKISPALPGVAIATAIVPPLANCGLCFSLGAYVGGIGSFLLFFANFLSILLVASITFSVFGLARHFESISKIDIIKRFGLVVVSFLIVAGFLTNALFKIARENKIESKIRTLLSEELSAMPVTGLEKLMHEEEDGKMYVLANIHSSSIVSPRQVKRIESRMAESVGMPTELIIRSVMSRDISSVGSTNKIVANDLDGSFISVKLHPKVEMTRIAEKVIREYTSSHFGIILLNVEVVELMGKQDIFASVISSREISETEISHLEKSLGQALNNSEIRLMVRLSKFEIYNNNGLLRHQWMPMEYLLTVEQRAVLAKGRSFLENQFIGHEDVFLENLNASFVDGQYCFLIELTGKRYFSDEEVRMLEKKMSEETANPVKIYAWSRPEIVAVSEGYAPYDEVTKAFFSKRKEIFKIETEKLLEEIH